MSILSVQILFEIKGFAGRRSRILRILRILED